HAADRYDRKRIALATQALQCLVAVTFALLSSTGALSQHVIYAGAALTGTALAFQSPSLRALLPALVERTDLPHCIASGGAVREVAVVAGPGLGGFIYVLGPAAVYGACAVCFLVAALLFSTLRTGHATRVRAPATLEMLFAGVRYIRDSRVVLGAITL